MNFFVLPGWIRPHLYPNKKFADLTEHEIQDLRTRLALFRVPDPLISVVVPAWNEENNLFRTLSSLAANAPDYPTEIIVINNNSTDATQKVLDELGVKTYIQPTQGTQHARHMGLLKANGKYHLCADSDTFYPPDWINLMAGPLMRDSGISCVYGSHSFVPPAGQGRFGLALYELASEYVIWSRKRKQKEFINVYGFNMAFETQKGIESGAFRIQGNRRYANIKGADFVNESEDGRMALNLMAFGRLHRVGSRKATVFTSSRRLMDDGSIAQAFLNRVKRQFRDNK